MTTENPPWLNRRLLVVEPDRECRQIIAKALLSLGAAEPIVAETAALALRALIEDTLDGAIIDVALPDDTATIVAYHLVERAVPFACIVGPGVNSMTAGGRRIATLPRPLSEDAIVGVLKDLFSGPRAEPSPTSAVGNVVAFPSRSSPISSAGGR